MKDKKGNVFEKAANLGPYLTSLALDGNSFGAVRKMKIKFPFFVKGLWPSSLWRRLSTTWSPTPRATPTTRRNETLSLQCWASSKTRVLIYLAFHGSQLLTGFYGFSIISVFLFPSPLLTKTALGWATAEWSFLRLSAKPDPSSSIVWGLS